MSGSSDVQKSYRHQKNVFSFICKLMVFLNIPIRCNKGFRPAEGSTWFQKLRNQPLWNWRIFGMKNEYVMVLQVSNLLLVERLETLCGEATLSCSGCATFPEITTLAWADQWNFTLNKIIFKIYMRWKLKDLYGLSSKLFNSPKKILALFLVRLLTCLRRSGAA